MCINSICAKPQTENKEMKSVKIYFFIGVINYGCVFLDKVLLLYSDKYKPLFYRIIPYMDWNVFLFIANDCKIMFKAV